MATVADLLKSKGSNVLTVDPSSTVYNAMMKMEEISAGTAIVVDNDAMVGIISERDVIRKVLLDEGSLKIATVADVMSTDLTTITAETSLEECMQLITDQRVRHLPVLCGERLCGIISIGDVVKYLIVEKDFRIKNLETYISGAM